MEAQVPEDTSETLDGPGASTSSLEPHWQLIVLSIGTADFEVIRRLEAVCPLSGAELARILYRAPAQLFPSLPAHTAHSLQALLAKAGLEVVALPADHAVTPGDGCLDVALEFRDFSASAALLNTLIRALGVNGREARDLLCSSPCQLLGQVSEATVQALEARFRSLGATVRAVDPRASVYDLYLTAASPHVVQRLLENLAAMGLVTTKGTDSEPGVARLVPGLTWAQAEAVWNSLNRRGDLALLLNREFARYDVVLDACSDVLRITQPLVALTGMPVRAVGRVLQRLPVVVLNNVGHEEAMAGLRSLALAGALAHAEPLSMQSFQAVVSACPKPLETARVLQWLLDIPQEESLPSLRASTPYVVSRKLSAMRGRWLLHEMTQLGTQLNLEKL